MSLAGFRRGPRRFMMSYHRTSTYSFSPNSGLINNHVVNSIYPAPHQAVYDSLRLSLGKIFGSGLGEGPSTGAGRAACSDNGATYLNGEGEKKEA